MLSNICLTREELVEVTGLKRFSAQTKWLRREGFVVKRRSDGMPLVSRSHFQSVMGVLLGARNTQTEQEPDFRSLL